MLLRSERVFWSGGGEAELAARTFAEKTGRTTLEMTVQGQLLKSMGREATRKMWKKASKKFAKSAVGKQSEAHVFIYEAKFRGKKSTWLSIEKKVLRKHNISIIEHLF